MSLSKLEQQAIDQMNVNSSRASGINNKTILFELLSNDTYPRLTAPVKAATLYYTKQETTPTADEYMKKVTSIKNSLDTLISNYNNKMKIENDSLLAGTTLNNVAGMISISK